MALASSFECNEVVEIVLIYFYKDWILFV